MLDCQDIHSAFQTAGASFFVGVPDSLLKSFCACVATESEPSQHIIAANEGAAIAIAAGHFLATGNPAVAYFQNSGQGNAVNPLVSLADPEVYAIPMVLLVGWRGEPGVADEPQHQKQGRITLAVFDALEVPCVTLAREPELADQQVADCVARSRIDSRPVALIVRKNSFSPYSLSCGCEHGYPLTREEAIKTIVSCVDPQAAVVATTGMAARELFEYRAASGATLGRDFLTVGSMGHASQIALGIAHAKPEQNVICLDGDGALIMHMGGLTTIGQHQPKNLLHVVLNNGAHDSVGGQSTAGFETDIVAVAKACGYQAAVRVETKQEIADAVAALASFEGPALIEIRIRCGVRSDLGRPTTSPIENKKEFMCHIHTPALAYSSVLEQGISLPRK